MTPTDAFLFVLLPVIAIVVVGVVTAYFFILLRRMTEALERVAAAVERVE